MSKLFDLATDLVPGGAEVKLGTFALKAGVIAAAIGGLVLLGFDYHRLRGVDHDGRMCLAAIGKSANDLSACPAPIGAAVGAQRRATTCDAALTGGDLYAIRANCSDVVKTLQAHDAATASSLADARAIISQANAAQAAAVSRAEARGIVSAQRKTRNARIIDDAPHATDGSVLCGTDCLLGLTGAGAGGGR